MYYASEDKFLQLMIDSLKNPLCKVNKKSNSLNRLLFMLNEYAKNILSKSETHTPCKTIEEMNIKK